MRILNIVLKSLYQNRRAAFNQFIVILILAMVITGSLLTGFSVRQSLKSSALERIGNAGYMISSGIRFFNPVLSEKIAKRMDLLTVAVLETDGFCQKFGSDIKPSKSKIYGIDSSFFNFLGYRNIMLHPGEIAVNRTLAERINVNVGEEVVLNINIPEDIPANSPFAPSKNLSPSRVLKVIAVIDRQDGGDFSTAINQVNSGNIFLRLDEINPAENTYLKANRIFISSVNKLTEHKIDSALKSALSPADIGLKIRRSIKTNETEIVSSRIFIDKEIIGEIMNLIPKARPIITYLVNDISVRGRSTPYSFVSAIDSASYIGISGGNKIVINKWLADDLQAGLNDTLILSWYEPGKIRELEEKTGKFIVSGISVESGIWTDSLLMPEFPGIAGSKTCTDWDAGVEIKTDRIRDKDEKYWNDYRGTPKAFLSYNKGEALWGNNFGPATSIRIPESFSVKEVEEILYGRIDPAKSGFVIRDIKNEMIKASSEGVDFSTLFLSLGCFIIAASLFLMILALTSYLESKEKEFFTLFAIGFKDKLISRMLLIETGTIAVAGSVVGGISGIAFNSLVILLLNSVWVGAVQTTGLSSFIGIMPVIAGFLLSVVISLCLLIIWIRKFLRSLHSGEKGIPKQASRKINIIILCGSSILTLAFLIMSIISPEATSLSFASGALVFISLLLIWRQMLIGRTISRVKLLESFARVTGSYYKFHPYRGVMPVLLISAGLFAVIVTGINRLQINEKSLLNPGGTGGFELWAETSAPVKEDLNSISGRKTSGLEEKEFSGVTFVQAKVAAGDNASCLNLNYVSSPPILGVDPAYFMKMRSFSFRSLVKNVDPNNPWEILTRKQQNQTVFGYADQTVLEWGLKKKAGDTLKFRSESGERFNVVIAGGLKSSVFQGYLLIGNNSFSEFYPSIPGSSVMLIDCEGGNEASVSSILRNRFQSFGIDIIPAARRLEAFFSVTNTYLTVFTTLGGFGMILGVAGLGFVLRQNYRSRKREFALLLATGFREKTLKRYIITEQLLILTAGVITGLMSAFVSTYPSIKGGTGVPWISLLSIIAAIICAGVVALLVSLRGIGQEQLIGALRKE